MVPRRRIVHQCWLVWITSVLVGLTALTAASAVASTGPVVGEGRTVFYVSPDGSDTDIGTSAKPFRTLERAQQAARSVDPHVAAAKDVTVFLYGGTYRLTRPLDFDPRDSGRNGHHVIWRNVPGQHPVVSGGRQITGWHLVDQTKKIWAADVGDLKTRQLYVDGRRVTRARGPMNPQGFTKTSTGYIAPDATMASWRNPSDIEVVSRREWKQFRCPVASVKETTITMQQPCWHNTSLQFGMGLPSWIENAYELLDLPGEWYLDRQAGRLYYIPKADEDISTADVVAPVLQTLVRGEGTLDEPLRDVRFEGITFAHATWLAPNTDEGYAVVQAGFRIVGSDNPVFNQTMPNWVQTPAALVFQNARGIELRRNTFTHLGAAGVNLETGSQGSQVVGNRFEDISSTGIQVGGTMKVDHHPGDPRQIVKDNTVSSNVVARVAVENADAVGIFVGYTTHTTVAHNEVFDLPYTGISVGWGWGLFDAGGNPNYPGNNGLPVYDTPTTSRDNQIRDNRIFDVMKTLRDGAGIYALSAQPGTQVSGNYIDHVAGNYGGLYPDEASAYQEWTDNVVQDVPIWLHIWTSSIHDLLVADNYTDQPFMRNNGRNITMKNNTAVQNGEWPARACRIAANSGLEPDYADLLSPSDAAPELCRSGA